MSEKINSFADIYRLLDSWPVKPKTFRGTELMRELLEHLGNPHERLRIVHVAGTSGKTSTAYYAAALLKASGKRVGLTVSPHLWEINERVQLDMKPLAEAEFVPRFNEYLQLIEPCTVKPNYFELFLGFALWEFAARKVDYAVVEVGIGGLLDSTNVAARPDKVCVITDIGFDHMGVLGNTLGEIAAQKAGIIQLHNAAFCYQQNEEVDAVIRETAKRQQADLQMLSAVDRSVQFASLPLFQQRNLGLAVAAVEYALNRDGAELPEGAIEQAAHTQVPGRMELRSVGDKTLVLDVAHNAQKFEVLLGSVRAQFPDEPIAALVRLAARSEDKTRLTTGLEVVANQVRHVIITSLTTGDHTDGLYEPQAAAEVCDKVNKATYEVIADPKEAFAALCKRPEPVLLVAGSFLLLSRLASELPPA